MKRLSLRTRLTLAFSGLFALMAAALLALDYTLLEQNLPRGPSPNAIVQSGLATTVVTGGGGAQITGGGPNTGFAVIAKDLSEQTLHQMLIQSGITLGLATVLAALLGWLLAGRVMDPVKAVTAQARRISERNLHERIGLAGPQDEVKDLADTFDAMLARLDAAFEGQRLFVANASHELRTPLAITRTAIDVQLQRRHPTPEQWEAMADLVLESTARSERLIDSLLMLARIEQGSPLQVDVDLGAVLEEVAAESRDALGDVPLRVEVGEGSGRAVVRGDPELLRRLVGNLLENAVRHNRPLGWVRASLAVEGRSAVLTVANSGELLSAETVGWLRQPFHRGGASRSAGGGVGLGLSIVSSIVERHNGSLELRPLPEGGLLAVVRLPLEEGGGVASPRAAAAGAA
ncbi:MAG TPA: HAMP domain-containing sensor histidine kinase [Candidatus Dormibacteraeota bacterium]